MSNASREAMKESIKTEMLRRYGVNDIYLRSFWSYMDAAIDALPAAEDERLDPEEVKSVLKEALHGCGPTAVAWAEAAINAMAGIETPVEQRANWKALYCDLYCALWLATPEEFEAVVDGKQLDHAGTLRELQRVEKLG